MLEVLGEYKMLSFDENGWLFPDPLKNITHDIDSAEIDDRLKLAKEEDYWLDCRGFNDKKYRRNCYFNAFW